MPQIMPTRLRAYVIALVGMLPAAILATAIVWLCHGHFGYSLDDPYIHLAPAQHNHALHYGINAGEFSAPSSSILWPLLLAPLAGWGGYTLVALAINIVCLYATLVLTARQLDSFDGPRAAFVVAIVAFALNFYGVFTDVEHRLHELLAVSAAVLWLARERDPAD